MSYVFPQPAWPIYKIGTFSLIKNLLSVWMDTVSGIGTVMFPIGTLGSQSKLYTIYFHSFNQKGDYSTDTKQSKTVPFEGNFTVLNSFFQNEEKSFQQSLLSFSVRAPPKAQTEHITKRASVFWLSSTSFYSCESQDCFMFSQFSLNKKPRSLQSTYVMEK